MWIMTDRGWQQIKCDAIPPREVTRDEGRQSVGLQEFTPNRWKAPSLEDYNEYMIWEAQYALDCTY